MLGSNAKAAFGFVGAPLIIADEPDAYEVLAGQMMADAILTSQGKPGSPLCAIFIGTLAPSVSGWWHDLVADGSHGSTYVQALRGDPERWDQWPEIRRVNPLTAISYELAKRVGDQLEKQGFRPDGLRVKAGDSWQQSLRGGRRE